MPAVEAEYQLEAVTLRLPIKVSSATSNFMIGVTAAASAGAYPRPLASNLYAGPLRFIICRGPEAFVQVLHAIDRLRNRQSVSHDGAFAKLGQQRVQGQIRLRGQPSQQPVALAMQQVRPPAAHRLGRWAARRARPLRPLHDARNADVIQFRLRYLDGPE
jgi:hypothetical protein